jgi:hypothetical protein
MLRPGATWLGAAQRRRQAAAARHGAQRLRDLMCDRLRGRVGLMSADQQDIGRAHKWWEVVAEGRDGDRRAPPRPGADWRTEEGRQSTIEGRSRLLRQECGPTAATALASGRRGQYPAARQLKMLTSRRKRKPCLSTKQWSRAY